MHSTVLLSSIFSASLVFAQNSTVSLFFPGGQEDNLVASIISANPTATTYAVQCATPASNTSCDFSGTITVTEGPATAVYTFPPQLAANGSVTFTGYRSCSLAGTTSGVCIESVGPGDAFESGINTVTYTSDEVELYVPVAIVNGPANVTASPTTSRSSDASKTSSTSSATTTSSSTAGAAVATGAKWMVGAAGFLALVV